VIVLLNEAIEPLTENKRKAIIELVKQAFFNISSVEAEETTLRGKIDLSGQEYLRIIEKKGAVSEATARIGAILGGGNDSEIKALGDYGRTLSLVMTIRDEFIDIFEPEELANRFARECLPLPILNVFKNPEDKDAIIQLLKGRKMTRKKTEKIVEIGRGRLYVVRDTEKIDKIVLEDYYSLD